MSSVYLRQHTEELAKDPSAWCSHLPDQAPSYPDSKAVEEVVVQLKNKPPLICSVKKLSQALQNTHTPFIFQGGDCAESFCEMTEEGTLRKISFFKKIEDVLKQKFGSHYLIMGRLGGQCAKPRSSLWEEHNGQKFPAFQGDLINGYALNQRTPDPLRMLYGYNAAQRVVQALQNAYSAFEKNFFLTHEAYLLPYEEGLCRSSEQGWYDSSAHSLWVGDRTRSLSGAHMAFVQGIINPIGVKIGPKITLEEIERLIQFLNPERIKGRLLFVFRLGAENISHMLPSIVEKFKQEPILWLCDPMHGNTRLLPNGQKTRDFKAIMEELRSFYRVFTEQGLLPSGIHCEMTGDPVFECFDPCRKISEDEIEKGYASACDPRLNGQQMLDLLKYILSWY